MACNVSGTGVTRTAFPVAPFPCPSLVHVRFNGRSSVGPDMGRMQSRLIVAERASLCTRATDTDSVEETSDSRDPEDVRGAIAVGLQLYENKKYQAALEVFEKALKLPGTGLKRFRDKPRLISEGEKQSVLYNIACCYSRLEDARTGLVALAGCLESGYENIDQLRSDPDLEFLRKDERFEGLMTRFNLNKQKNGIFDSLLKGFNL